MRLLVIHRHPVETRCNAARHCLVNGRFAMARLERFMRKIARAMKDLA